MEKENFWKQRSRQLWLSLGDANTGFFHVSNYEEEKISEVICSYYSRLFTSIPSNGTQIVQEALTPFAIHPDKAPGPDGFSAAFFQANWEITGPAIINEIQQFFLTGVRALEWQEVVHG